jgi:hypothetical protein
MQTVQRVERCLREVYRPHRMNLGEAASPWIAEHLHLPGVPKMGR